MKFATVAHLATIWSASSTSFAGFNGAFTDDTTYSCRWTSREKKYDCSWQSLTSVPSDIPVETEVLVLNNNLLTTIPNGVFDSLLNLKQLDIGSNRLTTLGNGLFSKQANLQILYLSNNKFQHIPAKMFGGLTRLQYLYLDHNDISVIDYGTFEMKTNWRTQPVPTPSPADMASAGGSRNSGNGTGFNLTSSNLVTGSSVDGAFDNLGALEFLYLDHNSLVLLQNTTIVNTTTSSRRLRRLLSEEMLTEKGTQAARKLSAVSQIPTVWNYQSATLPPTASGFVPTTINGPITVTSWHRRGHFEMLTKLSHLSLRKNNISLIPHDTFDKLTSLEHLDLYNNRISKIDVMTFRNMWNQLTNLQFLSLSNQIPTVQIIDQEWIDPNKAPIAPCNKKQCTHAAGLRPGLFHQGAQHGISQGLQADDW